MNPTADQVFDQPLETLVVQVEVLIQGGNHGRNDATEGVQRFLFNSVSYASGYNDLGSAGE